jgi:hypothetical protein
MAKKQVSISLRRPKQAEAESPLVVGTPDTPTVADTFVDSSLAESTPRTSATGATITTPSALPGRVVVSLQLPQELASQLLVRCLDEDRDASNVVTGLVREWLDGGAREREIGWRDVLRWARDSLTTGFSFKRAFGR